MREFDAFHPGIELGGVPGDPEGGSNQRDDDRGRAFRSGCSNYTQKAAPINAMTTGARMVIAHPALRSEVSVRAWNFLRFVLIAPSFSTTSVRNPPISVAIRRSPWPSRPAGCRDRARGPAPPRPGCRAGRPSDDSSPAGRGYLRPAIPSARGWASVRSSSSRPGRGRPDSRWPSETHLPDHCTRSAGSPQWRPPERGRSDCEPATEQRRVDPAAGAGRPGPGHPDPTDVGRAGGEPAADRQKGRRETRRGSFRPLRSVRGRGSAWRPAEVIGRIPQGRRSATAISPISTLLTTTRSRWPGARTSCV